MRTRRLALTLLAVGVISAVCWVSVWAWGNAWRDQGGVRLTVASGYAAGQVNSYTIRVTGPKLVCVDIDSNTYHACDPFNTPVLGAFAGAKCPQDGWLSDQYAVACDPMVTVNGGAVAIGDDIYWQSAATAKFAPPAYAWGAGFPPWDVDYDPFVCWYVAGGIGTQTYTIQVQGSIDLGATLSACDYYMMTITSTPWKTSGLLTPTPLTMF